MKQIFPDISINVIPFDFVEKKNPLMPLYSLVRKRVLCRGRGTAGNEDPEKRDRHQL